MHSSIKTLFAELKLESYLSNYLENNSTGVSSLSPINGQVLATLRCSSDNDYEHMITQSQKVFASWRQLPAPKRGEIVRQIGNSLRESKAALGELVSLEVGKIRSEGEGEVQEAIDIADFAVGLSRQLYGLSMHSERPDHRMYEQWHALGIVGVISAFNFPAAVWAWNAFIAAVCGDTVIWKPSEYAPLTALAMNAIAEKVTTAHGFPGVFQLLIDSGKRLGERLAADRRVPLLSATGSCAMGKSVAQVVAARFGRSILELGGNNAVIITADADLKLAVTSTVFGAAGTAGQRCTTTRRLLVEKTVYDKVIANLIKGYGQITIGNPLTEGVLMGPLIHQGAVSAYLAAIAAAIAQGGEVVYGAELVSGLESNLYVKPTIIKATMAMPIVSQETFAPILYVIPFETLEEALALHNQVDQGLSSAIFTTDLRKAERFLSNAGSDCGIANVNLGTSGAEIGGAFGGEKETGGGRESGSDAWKAYMRRQTNTINFGSALPLAQGVSFKIDL
jgi:aldehyde dehydrogenase (NAD+)